MRNPERPNPLFWPIVAIVLLLDLVTKLFAQALLPRAYTHDVLGDVVRLTLLYNRGAAFGLHVGPWSRVVLVVIAAIAVVVLVRMYRDAPPGAQVRVWALGLVTGGAASNALNRLWSPPGVVDFIDIGLGTVRWPAFNIADIAISLGAILLAWVLWREDDRRAGARPGVAGDGAQEGVRSARS